ncbi:MAG: hypothetical protein ACKOAG_09130, partial [Candidatus Kapaibacterium sp.]
RDIGNLNEYQKAVQDVLEGKVQVSVSGARSGSVVMDEGSTVAATAALNGFVVLGRRTRIGEDAVVTNSILGDDVVVESGARIDSCVLWNRVHLGGHSDISHDVVCNDTVIA